ncbi:protoporphyrinogen oxidase isoform X1 [Seriola aureovittata]|uniref:protoporphyrinogen oxidase isoform X1 n=1 Tax=Seriola aureovittata TaxID=2871759 RepID=UPI0024BE5294|nr:protoporphyrinogen oxidase isoform X1 [Seriola aureovittata]XP_056237182.1 protoporphyrinogen oxidase isoform X1 [Seriola aureovittata]XP_056237183.1 protoporphyrinogen oxidase isoform X1 [Seriola aureovittata]XP_056237185.1 protoporphyrinogen oxidase isoform X1 [Seriola aureovittata]XP_056237186.1 protoporphyrinogen oxidase isoform X1 [Seriola aureovittata]
MRTVAVLGGGIGGLAASYYLCKSPQVTKVVVLESSSRFGGWLWSTRRSDGAVFEHGPRGIRPAGAVGRNTLNMVEDLGLAGEILPVTHSHVASKNRYLYVKGQLHRMPSGISGLVRTVPPFSRPILLSVAMEILVKKSKEDDESIHSFVSRRLGEELADIAVDSLCRGVFAGDCRKLSVRSCFPVLYNAEQHRGSLILGMLLGSGPGPAVPPGPLAQRSVKESWAQWSLSRGVESLPESITDSLLQSSRVELHRDADVKHICPSASGWKIHLEDGVVSADHIISALPAKALSSALPSSCQPLIQELQEISTVTVAVVNLEYEGSILPVMGFGHLVPSSEDRGLMGIVYDSVPFPQHNRPNGQTTRLTVMMGGAWFQEEFGDPDTVTEKRLLERATEAVQSHLGVTSAPSWSWVALQRDCIPQYYLGHHQRVESMRSFIRKTNLPLSLTGSSYDGVSVNDVIFSGRTAVEQLLGTVI